MILSTENGRLVERVGDRRAIEIIANAGFDAIDYTFFPFMENGNTPWVTSDYIRYAKEVKQIADDNGVYFNQAHAPFLFDMKLLPNLDKEAIPMQIRCMEVCAMLGIPHMVVHPFHHLPYYKHRNYLLELNREYYLRLLPYSKEFGVKICLENMFSMFPQSGSAAKDVFSNPFEYAEFYDALGDQDAFICCADTGHSGITGEDPAETIRVLGSRVKALHVNDNGYFKDNHWIPYQGLIDWDDVLDALCEVNYSGDFTFEALRLYNNFDESFYPTAAKYLHDVGRYMLKKLEEKQIQRTNAK